jgi:hypothetical protein
MFWFLPLLVLFSGCVTGGTVNWVEGGVRPSHFKFKDVVPQRGKGAGGWRAACLHVGILRDTTEELVYCKFGVEVPIENEKQGFVPVSEAQSRAARCANEAAWTTLMAATPATPIGIACQEFKTLYGLTLGEVLSGSRVTPACYPGVTPVILTPRASLPR